jgi:hypothetical protein
MYQYYKLTSGDMIFGETADEDIEEERIIVNNPWQMMLYQGHWRPAKLPLKFASFTRNEVVFQGEPDDDLANFYRAQTGGIVAPSTPGLVVPGQD